MNPYEKAASEKVAANQNYGVGSLAAMQGVRASDVLAYKDQTDSEAFRKRLSEDLAKLGGRSTPFAAKTEMGPGAKFTAASLAGPATYGGATLNLGDDAAARAQQAKALADLRARAAGTATAPGVQQLYASLAKNNAASTAAAAAARSPNAGLAMRSLAARKAAASQQAASDASILKAQDQQASLASLANLETSMRGADMAGAQTQAGLTQNASLFSADALNKAAMARASGDQQASMFNASVAQEKAAMDQEIALANMRAYLQNQGLNDAAIASRMAMYQDAMNREKRDNMAFWDYALGTGRFNSSMAWDKERFENQQDDAAYAALGSAFGQWAGMAGSSGNSGAQTGAGWTDPSYDSSGKRKVEYTTSDARAKTNVRPGSSVLAKWLDELGGGR